MPEKLKSRILIVEDTGVVAKDIQHRLERLGCAVVGIAYSGDEAVEAAGRLSPDLIVMDMNLTRLRRGLYLTTRDSKNH
jgi:CheY-like chemotaxis protein